MHETYEGQLTYSKCFKVLSTLSNNKTPGNDGLTIEFYKFFWSEIGTLLVDSLNYACFHGELSSFQKQAVINLIWKTTIMGCLLLSSTCSSVFVFASKIACLSIWRF